MEKACSLSSKTFSNFINNQAEKFRIYTEQQVATFTSQKSRITMQNIHGDDKPEEYGIEKSTKTSIYSITRAKIYATT